MPSGQTTAPGAVPHRSLGHHRSPSASLPPPHPTAQEVEAEGACKKKAGTAPSSSQVRAPAHTRLYACPPHPTDPVRDDDPGAPLPAQALQVLDGGRRFLVPGQEWTGLGMISDRHCHGGASSRSAAPVALSTLVVRK